MTPSEFRLVHYEHRLILSATEYDLPEWWLICFCLLSCLHYRLNKWIKSLFFLIFLHPFSPWCQHLFILFQIAYFNFQKFVRSNTGTCWYSGFYVVTMSFFLFSEHVFFHSSYIQSGVNYFSEEKSKRLSLQRWCLTVSHVSSALMWVTHAWNGPSSRTDSYNYITEATSGQDWVLQPESGLMF